MQVWDGISDARIEFQGPTLSTIDSTSNASHYASPVQSSMATLTENLNLQRAALRRIEETGNVELVDEMKVGSILKSSKEEGGWPIVNLENKDGSIKRSLRARLLVRLVDIVNSEKRFANSRRSMNYRLELMEPTHQSSRIRISRLLGGLTTGRALCRVLIWILRRWEKERTLLGNDSYLKVLSLSYLYEHSRSSQPLR